MIKKKPVFSISARVKSFSYATKGLFYAALHEHNMWIHMMAAIAVILCSCYYHISSSEWIMVIICIALVMAAELFNSAIEKLVDLVSPEHHPVAGMIKDIAAAAVLVCAIAAAICGLIVFIPKLL